MISFVLKKRTLSLSSSCSRIVCFRQLVVTSPLLPQQQQQQPQQQRKRTYTSIVTTTTAAAALSTPNSSWYYLQQRNTIINNKIRWEQLHNYSTSFVSSFTNNKYYMSSSESLSSSSGVVLLKKPIHVPDHANIIVIGGGIIGTSVAYHLGKVGYKDVLLLEQNTITSGTTWHAAGLMTSFGSLSSTSIQLRTYTQELYKNILPNELAVLDRQQQQQQQSHNSDPTSSLSTSSVGDSSSVGYMPIGFIELATSKNQLQYLRRVMDYNNYCTNGTMNVQEITPHQIEQHCPIIQTTTTNSNKNDNNNNILAGFYSPNDGRINPTDVTMALAKCAKQLYNVTILENVTVQGICTSPNTTTAGSNNMTTMMELPKQVTGVIVNVPNDDNNNNNNSATSINEKNVQQQQQQTTTTKTISANIVVNCTGMWGRQFVQNDLKQQQQQQLDTSSYYGGVVPLQAAEHYYIITDDLPNNISNTGWPVIEDISNCMYVRPEGKGLLIGFFETFGKEWLPKCIPQTKQSFIEIQPDWDRMIPYIEQALTRFIPEIQNHIGIKQLFCGPESFTPDNQPIVGPYPLIRGYYIAAGMNSIGILTGGGIGKVISEWIINNGISPTTIDTTSINANRFHLYHNTLTYRTERVRESLGNIYTLHNPDYQMYSCRNVKQTSIHDLLLKQGAYFKNVSGWESPLFYNNNNIINNTDTNNETSTMNTNIPKATTTTVDDTTTIVGDSSNHNRRQNHTHDQYQHTTYISRPSWFPLWEYEHLSCRNNVALFDMTFMSKFLLQGSDAGRFLNYLSTADVVNTNHINNNNNNTNKNHGTVTYTQWLNPFGYIEADVTVTKLPTNHNDDTTTSMPSSFLVMATDTMHNHVYSYMMNALVQYKNQLFTNDGGDGNVYITDVTSRYVQLNIQGPQSRQFMERLVLPNDSVATNNDDNNDDTNTTNNHTTDTSIFSNHKFPYRSVQTIDIGYAPNCICSRITYVGELGYELYIPVEYSRHVYQRILETPVVPIHTTNDNKGDHNNSNNYDYHPIMPHAGLKALGSLRMEKGYRDYGHDIDNTDTIYDVNLQFTCNFNKQDGFIGIDQVRKQRDEIKCYGGPFRCMVHVFVPSTTTTTTSSSTTTMTPPLLYHGEIIYRNNVPVGYIRSSSYGHTLGGNVGLAVIITSNKHKEPITKVYIDNGIWEIQIATVRYPCHVSIKPWYDPKNERIKL